MAAVVTMAIPASGWPVDFVNQRWSEYTGLSFEELPESGWKRAIHPDDLATLAVKRETVDCAASAYDYEVRLRRSDGTFRWLSLRVNRTVTKPAPLSGGLGPG